MSLTAFSGSLPIFMVRFYLITKSIVYSMSLSQVSEVWYTTHEWVACTHCSLYAARLGNLISLSISKYSNKSQSILCAQHIQQTPLYLLQFISMELGNNALKIYRESLEFRRTNFEDTVPSTKCLQAYNTLAQCVLNNKINVLDAEAIRAQCQVDEWKSECPGALRRIHTERLFTKVLSRKLYTQQQLNKYMQTKNNFKHYGLIDARY